MEIRLGEHTYRIGRLNAFKQLDVVHRLLPCMDKLAGFIGAQPDEKNTARMADVLAALSDEGFEFITTTCLEVVERKRPDGEWAPVSVNGAAGLGLGLASTFQLTWQVIMENLSDFLHWRALRNSAENAASPNAPASPDSASAFFPGQPEGKSQPSKSRMIGKQEFLLRPVAAHMCSYKDLRDCSVSLFDVALMNEYLDVRHKSEKV